MIRKKRMSKGIAKILSGLLVFGMVAGLVPTVPGGTVHAKAEGESEQNVTAEPHIHCVCGKDKHPDDGQEHQDETWTGINSLRNNLSAGYYYLTDNVNLTETWTPQNGVVLCLNGKAITMKADNKDVIWVDGDNCFTLCDCKDIGIVTHGTKPDGTTKYSGRGVYILGNSTFTMYGGVIYNNNSEYGGGVSISSTRSLEMFGGKISKNEADYGGGIYNEGQKEVTMKGGNISDNTSRKSGGGVYLTTGTFNMSGGTITDNVSKDSGGGVCKAAGTFNMSGGTITDNTSKDSGGGVYNATGTFNMSGGEIKGNKSGIGGGVYNAPDSFTKIIMSGQAEISNNQAASVGGGVFASKDNAIILNNAVKITGNTVGSIANNLYLRQGTMVEAKMLSEGAKIGVTTEDKPTENSSVIITDNAASASCFSSDNSDYVTDIDENKKVVLKKKPAVEAPSITKQPQPVSVKVGETATFTVEAAGADLSYQWMVDKNDNRGFVDIAGATSESYTLNAISKEYNGYRYQCMVSIPSGHTGHTISDCVTLTVTEDAAPTPNPNPTPTPEPTPEPNPTPAPNPTPEATSPTPDPAPATSTPAASTTTAPASSAAAAPVQVTYDILDGAGSSWTQNTDGSLAIRGSGEISKFREVKVDGVTVDPVNYTVTEGSTIITFKPEYLKSLSAGNHSFELVWTDGTAATNFTVAENADQSAKSPKTGEDFSRTLCTVLLMVSCAGLAGIFAKRKRNHAR